MPKTSTLFHLTALSATAFPGKLAALRAVADLPSGGDLPDRLQLLKWGANETIDGPVYVGPATLASLAANQERWGFDRVGIDYNHQSVPDHPNFKPDPREYAAYGVPEIVEGDGLYLAALSWTPSGKSNARNYADLSPTPLLDANREVIFLHSVALCPQGKVKGLSFFSAEFLNKKQLHTYAMNEDLKKLLAILFGVDAETATDESLLEAGKTFAEKLAAKKEAPSENPPDVAALSADVMAIKGQIEADARDRVLADAMRDGKLVPQSVRDLPLDAMRKVVADLPKDVVPLSARTPEGIKSLGTLDALSATDKQVAAQLGITAEDWRK